MTDELTSEQEAAVRRLLSEARHDAPVPADVAARLDEVLDGLVADAGADDLEVFESGPTSGSVTELAGVRRRRRNAGRLLLAAAAVVVGGVAVGQALGEGSLDGGGDADSSAAGGQADDAPRETASRDQTAPESVTGGAGDDSGADQEDGAAAQSAGATLMDLTRAPLELTSDDFAADVQRELGRTAEQRRHAAKLNYNGVAAYAETNPDFMCAVGPYGEGAALPAYYDAEEAVLVLRRPRSGIQHVDLLTCGTAVPLNSVDLPVGP